MFVSILLRNHKGKGFCYSVLLSSCDIWHRWFKEFQGRRLLQRRLTVFRRVTSIYTKKVRVTKTRTVTKTRRVTKSYKEIESYKDNESYSIYTKTLDIWETYICLLLAKNVKDFSDTSFYEDFWVSSYFELVWAGSSITLQLRNH